MKKQPKSQKILAMLDKGMTAAQIAEKLSVKPAYVYVVKSAAKKKVGRFHRVMMSAAKAGVAMAQIPVPSPTVNTPDEVQVGGDHYKDNTIQVWDAIHDWGLGYFSGNVVKYVARHQKKNGVEDLKKARHYLDKLISIAEKQGEE
jgi:DNA-binding CsgD family transcriptional regulator